MTGRLQAFTTDEFEQRLTKVQENMQREGIDLLMLHAPENIYYLSGYQTSGYFAYQTLIVTPSGAPTLLVRYLERGGVVSGVLIVFILSFNEFTLSYFLYTVDAFPLSIWLFQQGNTMINPTIFAVSTAMIVINVAIIILVDRIGAKANSSPFVS